MTETFLDNNESSQCCGCSVCADSCPVKAIGFKFGTDGARYPYIDTSKCISCGKCRNVCPFNTKPSVTKFEKKACALVLESEQLREKSASGGAFEAIATALHEEYDDLMIAGAAWDENLRVSHKLVPYDKREILKKSKYVQSDCEGIYMDVKDKLGKGIHVLFTGTPCQTAALKNYLRKDYDNLFTVDLICHGVPGERILDRYLSELSLKRRSKVTGVTFRHKKKDLYGEIHSKNIRVEFENGKAMEEDGKTDPYLRGFQTELFYRDSCYACRFADKNRTGDITIGDYWRIQELDPEYVDYTGVSCLLFNTEKGWALHDKLKECRMLETDVEDLYKRNGQLVALYNKKAPARDLFFSKWESESFEKLIDQCVKKEKKYKRIVSSLLPGKLKRNVKKILRKGKKPN